VTSLRIVRGQPTAEELAVVIALASAASGDDGGEPALPARGRWNDPAAILRRPTLAGPGGWRAAAR
jgi:acyl-CoA carboxylase epsilon subunit